MRAIPPLMTVCILFSRLAPQNHCRIPRAALACNTHTKYFENLLIMILLFLLYYATETERLPAGPRTKNAVAIDCMAADVHPRLRVKCLTDTW